MNSSSTPNPAKTAGVLMLACGALVIVISLTFTYFSNADNFLTFDLTQVFWVGVFFAVLGLALWLLPALANSRNVALLIIAIGIVGIGVSLAYTTFNIADNFLSFDLTHILLFGVGYLVTGIVLLLLARGDEEPQPAPTKRDSQTRPIVAADTKPEKRTTGSLPKVEALAYAPRPNPDDLTLIEGIGVKAQEALNKAGVFTFSQLANMTSQEIYQVVKIEQGVKIVGDTATWSKQAQYLVDGDLKGLKAYQAKLLSGREEKK